MAEFEKIAASLRHCAAGIGHCRECCEYGEPGCSRLLKEEAAETIEALLQALDTPLQQRIN